MKKEGSLLPITVIVVIVMSLLLASGGALTANFIKNMKTDALKTQCGAIDQALESWSKAHIAVKEDSITYTENGSKYNKLRLYPANLQDLQTFGYLAKSINVSAFRYSTRDSGTSYRIEVTLPNKQIYKSPGSDF